MAATYAWPVIEWSPFVAGLAAGLGIALPLGAIGVLIVREGVERGIRAAVVAALAVASVDFGYALVAVVVGERIAQALSGVERMVQLVGALALTVVVVLGVRDLLRSMGGPVPGPTPSGPPPLGPTPPKAIGGALEPGEPSSTPPRQQPPDLLELPVGYGATFLRFVGLTAINPMTAVYFVALTAGLSQRLAGARAGAAFAIGVFVGSLAWQLVLAAGGGLAGARMSDRVRLGVSLAGYAIVAGYAVRLALDV